MKQIQMFLLLAVLIFVVTALGQETKSAADASPPTVPTSGRAPGTVLPECPECPEMVVIPAGSFTMGSSAEEKSWAARHGRSMYAVADEAALLLVLLPSFALGKYDATRGDSA